MSVPSDHYRRKNEAARKAQMEALVEARKDGWRENGVLDDVARGIDPDYDESVWQGRRWWVENKFAKWAVNVLLAITVVVMIKGAANLEAGVMLVGIPVLFFLVQLRIHIARFGA